MRQDNFKYDVKCCLEESGYDVVVVPEDQNFKRVDLLAKSESDSLLVEVKCKYDDINLYRNLSNAQTQEIIPYQSTVDYSNSLSAVIKEACQQIDDSQGLAQDAFGVLWFHPEPKLGFSESEEQIKMTLYGGRWAFVDTPDGSNLCMQCFYTTYSDFYRYKSLDCLILNINNKAQLLPNTFSPRLESFKQSQIFSDFEGQSAIWSPEIEEKSGSVLCLKSVANLKDIASVKRLLELQYPNHKFHGFVDLSSYGGVMKI